VGPVPVFSAGSASVSIVPDFSGAQRAIGEFFARQTDIKVKVVPDLDNTSAARIQAQLNGMHGTAKVDVDKNFLSNSIATALQTAFGSTGLDKIGAGLSAAIKPTIMAAAAGAFTELAAVASQAAGAIALVPAGLAAIITPAATVAIGVRGVGDAFKALDTGNATKIAAAMSNLAPAARDFVTQVHALGPAFTGLRLDVQQSLFSGVGTAVTNLAKVSLPILHSGLTSIASGLNEGLLATMTALQGQSGNFATLFGNIGTSLHIAAGAAAPLVQAFGTLAAVGSQFLPGLAQGFVNVAKAFNDWIQRINATGQLAAMIQNAINVLKQLAELAGNVIGIVSGIFTAALPYGQIFLDQLIKVTQALSTFIHSAEGQSALSTFFAGITAALGVILPALEVLVQALIADVLPAIGEFAAALAPVAGTLMVQLAAVLDQVAGILPPVATVMASLVSAMAPLIPVIGTIVTALLPPLVDFLGKLAPIISQVAQVAGGILLAATKALAPILPIIGDAFIHILNAITPMLDPLAKMAKELFPPLAQVIQSVVGFVRNLVDAVAPLVTAFLKIVDAAVLPFLVGLISNFAAGLKVVAGWIGPLPAPVKDVALAIGILVGVVWLLNAALAANPIGIVIVAIGLLIAAIGFISTHLQFFKDLWNTVWTAVKDFFETVWTAIKDFFTTVWGAIVNWWNGVATSFVTTWTNIWTSIRDFFVTVWNAIKDFFVTVWTAIVNWFSGVVTSFVTTWTNVWTSVRDFFVTIWTAIKDFFTTLWTAISTFVQGVWNAIVSFFTTAWTTFTAAWTSFWNTISTFFQGLWNGLVSWIQGVWNGLASWFTGVWNAFTTAWTNFWNAIFAFFQGLWNGLVAWVEGVWNSLASFFTGAWNALSTAWQAVWNGISSFFSTIWNGIKDTAVNVWNAISGFFAGAFDAFKNAFTTVWNTIKDAFTSIWQGMKDGVAAIWDGIKAVFAAPINFVIRYILNDGLFKAWNWIVDTLNLPGHDAAVGASGSWKLHVDEIPGFETGGYTGNLPRTAPAGVVHGGEFVFTKAQTDAAGLDQLYAYAAALDGRSGGFYAGGYVSPALSRVLPGFAPGGAVPGAMTWSELWATVHGHDSRTVLTSAYRPGANDYHGLGQAIDVSYPGNPQSLLMPLAAWIASTFPYSTELIHNPNASIKNGKPTIPPAPWGAATWAAHQNHVHWAMTPDALASGGALGAGGITGLFGEVWHTISDVFGDLTNSITKPLGALISQFGDGGIAGLVGQVPGALLGVMWDTVKGTVEAALQQAIALTAPTSPITSLDLTPGDVAGLKSEAAGIANAMYGWNSAADASATNYIVSHESGWNPRAQNPTSTASGLWQHIHSTWLANRPPEAAQYANMKDAPSAMQDRAGFKYVHDKYKTLPAAQAYWAAHSYYDNGGWLPPGHTSVYNGTGGFEAVLNQAQQAAVVGAVNGHHSDDGVPVWHFYLGDKEITDLIDARVAHQQSQDARTIRSYR
jgi:phage-related protein